MRTRTWLVAAAVGLMASASWGAGFSVNPEGVPGESAGLVGEGTNCGAVFLTQSTAQSIQALNSVSCNVSGLHADNRYFRAYDMTAFPDGFDVCEVQVGIELAQAGVPQPPITDGVLTQPITVNIYSNVGGPFPAGVLTLRGSVAVGVADQALTVLPVPFAAGLPAGTTEMVLEVFTPNGQAAGHRFFIGSNNLGQSGTSFIEAADCGINAPTPTGDIGFPGMHIVLNAIGDPQLGGPSIVEIPTLGSWGVVLLGMALAAAAFVVLRKRSAA